MLQIEAQILGGSSFDTPELERPSRPEAQGSDDRIWPENRFVVGVPADRVRAISVEVGQDRVEGRPEADFEAASEGLQQPRQGPGLPGQARVGVGHRTRPERQSGLLMELSIDPHGPPLERDLRSELLEVDVLGEVLDVLDETHLTLLPSRDF